MLNPKRIPTPLILPGERSPLPVQDQPPAASFRTFYLLVHLLGLLLRIFWLWLGRRLSEDRLGDLLRDFCQRMGVIWIKLGQLISMRADLAPLGVRNQLAKLLDRVQGFPGEVAVGLIEKELGVPLGQHFSHFERKSLAAASIGQVHKAWLKEEKVWVAVKVRRPDVQRVADRDMLFIRFLIRILVWLRFKPHARWPDLFWELQEAMIEELDYRFELTNMQRMKKLLRRHGIYVPDVFPRYCTPSILVMEFIHGVLMSDYLQMAHSDPARLKDWREDNNVKPPRIARHLLHSFFRQAFEENLFHGDLHPGNIVLLRDDGIAFLDYGSLGSLERDLTRNVDLYIQTLGGRQYAKMVDIFFLFSPSLPPTNLTECKNEMIRRLQAWDLRCRVRELPYPEKSYNAIQDELVFFASGYGISPVWSFFRMTRTMATMDASLRELIPQGDFHRLVNSYYQKRIGRTRDRLAAKLRRNQQNMRNWLELQDRLLDDARFRSGIVRRAAQVFERTSSTVALFLGRLFAQLARLLLVLGVLMGLTFLCQQDPPWAERHLSSGIAGVIGRVPPLDYQVWFVLFGVLVYVQRRFARLSRRFHEQDVERGQG